MLTLIIFIIILGLLVFVHEAGHFFTARKCGVKSEEFGFGFPPRICGWKKINGKRKFFWGKGKDEEISEDTVYSLNWIPLGGFVKIKGEEGEGAGDPDSFASQKIWKRSLIIVAGVVMNFVLAVVLLSVGFMIGLPQVVDDNMGTAKITDAKIQIVDVLKGTPAAQAGLETSDTILSADSQKFSDLKPLQDYIDQKTGSTITFELQRDTQTLTKEVVPVKLAETGRGGVGIGLIKTGLVSYPWYISIWKGFAASVNLVEEIVLALWGLITGLIITHKVAVDLSGPVGIAVLTGHMVRMGFIYLLQFTALLSINLAIVNILPFPALDGGRLLFLLIEKVRGKPVNSKIENSAHNIGFALLMLLIIVVTYRDVLKFSNIFVNLWHKIIY